MIERGRGVALRAAIPSGVAARVLARLAYEHPVVDATPPGAIEYAVDVRRWLDRTFDPVDTDAAAWEALTRSRTLCLVIDAGAHGSADVSWVTQAALTRVQHLRDVRNAASDSAAFDAVLACHLGLHDLSLPLVAADFIHARDTWQWLLRIEPHAGTALQTAALFHDVDRLTHERRERLEWNARDYAAYKAQHAARAAEMVHDALAGAGLNQGTIEHAAALVAGHERAGTTYEEHALASADALSFFSLNAPGFLRYFGPAHTARKVAHALERLAPVHRFRLHGIRHAAVIEELIAASLARVAS